MHAKLSDRILDMPRVTKRFVALAVDAVLCVGTVAFAFWLRLDEWAWPQGAQWLAYLASLVFALPLFVSFGLYRAIFRYVGWGALMSVVRACTIYGLAYSFTFTLVGVAGVPRTIGALQPILLFLAVGASRASARYWLGGAYRSLLRLDQRRRVLIYGAGAAGRQLAGAVGSSTEMHVIGYVDDNPALHGSLLNGKTIYPSDDLAGLLSRLLIDDMLLAIPSASRQRRNQIIQQIGGKHVTIRTLPGLMDLAHGRVTVNDLREVDIEDLLGRDPVPPNDLLLSRNIRGKTVLVTGAGGSIGSELCRQIINLRPTRLILLDASEFNLYSIHRELTAADGDVPIVPQLASVQDEAAINATISTWAPDTIYHAAAYKHVPLVEDNVAEGIRNNVFGTLNTARAAMAHGVSDFVLISTDKAVRPTNVMGATKRLAEQVLQALAQEGAKTRLSMVRFGNVLGSSGSVVPLFRQQIKAGGPVTITHADITRYFMTIPEAAQLVIQAGAMTSSGEVYVLDMGAPVRIIDLARNMIELSGLTVRDEANPDGDIEIKDVGLRPGEKLYEELLIGNNPTKTTHSRIMKAREHFIPWPQLSGNLDTLYAATRTGDVAQMRQMLKLLVPEFQPEQAPASGAA
jgi:FlaA1/EpsC-like NDP-sugar epimerase